MAYDKHFKERVLFHLDKGHTQKETAALFGISVSTLKNWTKRRLAGEGLDAKIRKRKPKKIDPERLREVVAEHPDAFLRELAAYFKCTPNAIRKALQKLGITRKKNARVHGTQRRTTRTLP